MNKFTSGGDVKILLKVIMCDGILSNLIIRVEARVFNGDNMVGKELMDEFRLVGMVVCDDRDECRANEEL